MIDVTGCLILACGNTLRSDDGVGLWLADWAEKHFAEDRRIRIVARQQWTPDLAQDIAAAESVIFLDCSLDASPGVVQITHVQPVASPSDSGKHHLDAASLLALAQDLYGAAPSHALQITIGAGSTELGQQFTPAVEAALPGAHSLIQSTVHHLLDPTVTVRSSPA